MPLTIAHPAAVIPIERWLGRRVSLSALVIGSMMPDFAYFLPFWVTRADTHSVDALLWFCLPVGCVTYAVFHRFVKRPLLDVAPGVAARVHTADGLPDVSSLVVATSVVVGAATHVAWDAFTHEHTRIVQALPLLRAELFTVGGYHVFVFKALQHASTVLGVAFLWWWLARWWRTAEVRPVPTAPSAMARTIALALFVGLPVTAGLASLLEHLSSSAGARPAIGFAMKSALTGVGAGMLLFAALWHAWLAKTTART